MGSDAIARGTRVGNDQEHADRPRSPSELAPHDGWDQSRLDVEPADAFLQVGEPCLRLEDAKSAGGFVPGDGVRDTALTVLVERQFDLHRPAGASQDSDDLFDERGMGGVDERVASRALVARVEMQPDTERGGDLLERVPADTAAVGTLDPRDERLRHAGPRGQIDLAPAALAADGADEGGESSIIHGPDATRARFTLAYSAR